MRLIRTFLFIGLAATFFAGCCGCGDPCGDPCEPSCDPCSRC